VSQRDLNQWFFRITNYAEELLDQSGIDWPNKINIMQTNWIGKSSGTHVQFDISSLGLETTKIDTFTTRVDTIYGVTFLVISPEHPLVGQLTVSEKKDEVDQYVVKARKQSEIERLSTDKEKTGVFTGSYCLNPLTNEKIPIFVGDYVLLSYGTGIVMGVPAHDERDFKFAKKYDLDIRTVVEADQEIKSNVDTAYAGDGILVNSGPYNGLSSKGAIDKISEYLKSEGLGEKSVQYRMRDWLISRQRYWGTPIPIIYCDDCGTVPVPEKDLPVLLPDDAEFKPTGESPLELHERFVNVECPSCKKPGRRETDTMDTFVDSSWYFLRYASPKYIDGPFDPIAMKKWQPVDQYTGGAEHAVMHLLYSRFFIKALRDIGLLEFNEPFIRLFNQGHITHSGSRMSKSRGNVVSPDKYVKKVGADAVRCYLMFLGPWDQGGDWIDTGINGISRWLNRIRYLATQDPNTLDSSKVSAAKSDELNRLIHKTLKKVTEDLGNFKFNTTIAALMELTNNLNDLWKEGQLDKNLWESAIRNLLLMVAPLAPHIAEELWEINGLKYSIHSQQWPEWNPEFVKEADINLVVQVNGKVRDTILVSAEITESVAKETAMASQKIEMHIKGKEIKKTIYVPGKLVNIVAL
jgi:leucyl-tRNA synthetase